ncbi:EMB2076 [Symbiodinium sp. CCMP2592]|nr:EMB2076 [Symbiodinium sp. CCMP2592]
MHGLGIGVDEVSVTSALGACEKGQQWETALLLLFGMPKRALRADLVCINAAASAAAAGRQAAVVEELLGSLRKRQMAPDVYSYNALLNAYERSRLWQEALVTLKEMERLLVVPDVISFASAMAACELAARWDLAIALLDEARTRQLQLTLVACSTAVSACSQGRKWNWALWLLRAGRLASGSFAHHPDRRHHAVIAVAVTIAVFHGKKSSTLKLALLPKGMAQSSFSSVSQAMRFIIAVFAAACLADGFNAGCVGDECSAKETGLESLDDSVLVQKRRAPETVTTEKGLGLALEGGGFLAHATHTGVLTALVNRCKMGTRSRKGYMARNGLTQEGATSNGTDWNSLTELMSNVKVISSVSGGSWWMAQLGYSAQFLNLIETMAESPERAGELYKKRYIDPLLAVIRLNPEGDEEFDLDAVLRSETPLREDSNSSEVPANEGGSEYVLYTNHDRVVGESRSGKVLEVLAEIVFLTKTGDSWEQIVTQMLTSTTTDMSDSQTLGSPVNDWAKGKSWLIGTGISTPGGNGPGACHQKYLTVLGHETPILQHACGYDLFSMTTFIYESRSHKADAWKYTAPLNGMAAIWTPARFSTVLGSGAPNPSPMKFCELEECGNLQLQYQANGKPAEPPNQNDYTFATSGTSLLSAVSASSAAVAFSVALGKVGIPPFLAKLSGMVMKQNDPGFDEQSQTDPAQPGLMAKLKAALSNLMGTSGKLAVWAESAQNAKIAFTEVGERFQNCPTLYQVQHAAVAGATGGALRPLTAVLRSPRQPCRSDHGNAHGDVSRSSL